MNAILRKDKVNWKQEQQSGIFQKLYCLVSSCSIAEDMHLNSKCCSSVCATLIHGHIRIFCHSSPFQGKKKLFPIVHFTTGNVEVRCSVDHSDIYGSRCTFKCKLIFTVGNMRHNDTYLQNPKGRLNKSKKKSLTDYILHGLVSIWRKT